MVLGKIASLHEHLVSLELPSASASSSGIRSVIPLVEVVLGTITYLVIIIMTVIGNSMVVLAVFNYRPLKKVQNYFLVSLAASDLAVAVFVMPLHVVKFLAGRSALLRINDLPPERRDTQRRTANEREDEPFLNNNDDPVQKADRSLSRQFSQESSKTTSGNRSSREPPKETAEQITRTVLRKREKISVAKEKRAAKTIAVIIFVFSFCWLPFFCAYVILPFCESCSIHPKVAQAFTWLGYINSSLNPFLYGILNLEFRRAFKKILCSKTASVVQNRRSIR
ncbi:hypothetical protein QR680_001669 [Steinernema hermaphroditum]|uniref:G-protein coupled receptors family 1 profile domain-containing protein n=1 Tax=Steinernema hermaphroditum TaxID=289476 RepID=A0AA39LGI4_9BILA|nr:hypothetical protein QR680_001669 [Steinernema hermaphroditum]